MTYFDDHCRTAFTDGQIYMMQHYMQNRGLYVPTPGPYVEPSGKPAPAHPSKKIATPPIGPLSENSNYETGSSSSTTRTVATVAGGGGILAVLISKFRGVGKKLLL